MTRPRRAARFAAHPLAHALLFGATAAAGCALRYAAHTRPKLGAISARTDT